MNVLHLLDTTNRGGAEILTLDVCKNAKENGLDLIFVSMGKGELETKFENSGVTYFKLNRRYPLDLSIVFKLRKIIKKYNIKIIHSHLVVAAVHAYFATRGLNVKNILTHHGFDSIRKIKDEVWRKYLISRIDLNISVSKSFLEQLKKEKGYKVSENFLVVHNGIDARKIFKTKRNFRSELNLSDSNILLGMVGNFHNDGRDQLTVCKSLPIVFSKYPQVHFAFVGGRSNKYPQFFDECYDFCKKNKIIERNHFVGSRSDVNDILSSFDLFVYCSNHDTFGISVIEAMIQGLPIIINDLPPLLEVTNNGKYAKVFKSKSYNDLAEKIIETIDNIKVKLPDEGKTWALNQFSIEQHIKNLLKVYKDLLCAG